MEVAHDFVTVVHPSGEINVPAVAVMQFTTPMWGFEAHREFALLPSARQGIWWFISAGDNPATFVLADPFVAMPDYALTLSDAEREELVLQDEQDALVLVLLVMPLQPGEAVTGNFRAPLVFNLVEQKVKQVVNPDDSQVIAGPISLGLYPVRDAADDVPSPESQPSA